MNRWLKSGSLLKRQIEESDSDDGAPTKKSTKTANRKIRKYCDQYLSFGFSSICNKGVEKPICVLCHECLSNESMKPAKLRRHLETKHSEHVSKSADFFELKKRELASSQKVIQNTATGCMNEKAVRASYQVSLLVAKAGKSHTIAEQLILPATKVITSTMLGDKATKDLHLISLSNDTVKNRIEDMANNIKEQLVSRVLKSQYYSLQLDESTDISNNANLLAFIRYEFDNKVQEDLLFCHSLPTHTTAEALFNSLNNFLTKNEIEWKKCIGISTDGARAMSGRINGLVACIKAVAPSVTWNHCCIHREALASKNMSTDLKQTLDEVVKVVNFIKARPLNSRIFKVLCEELGSQHKQLLLHAEVRWLSRGKVLNRLFELRDEIRLFLMDTKFQLTERFHEFSWLVKVAYLADIFTYLNELNLSLQGATVNRFKVEDKIEAIIKKFCLWAKRINNCVYESFPTLNNFIETTNKELPDEIRQIFVAHLMDLKTNFRSYFPGPDSGNNWIRDPFNTEVSNAKHLSVFEEDSLVEMTCDTSLKPQFNKLELTNFWLLCRADYPALANKALKHLIPFCTTYLCEQAFSTLFYVKSKCRNKLNVKADLRIKLSNIEPNIALLVSRKQLHPSHSKT